jgi:hypothetical protein
MLFIVHICKKKLIRVKRVHAGPAGTHTFLDDDEGITISPFQTFYYNGKKVNPKNYEIRRADGNCMAARGITNGDLLFIYRFREQDNKRTSISKGDILFIRKEKEGRSFYKIREFNHFDENGNAITYSYIDESTPQKSSSPHALDRIEGVVKMRFKSNP